MPDATPGDAAAGLAIVLQSLLRGFSHTLSNRVAALGALAASVSPGEPVDAMVARALGEEATRLEELLRLQRVVAGSGGATPEPVHLPDVLPDVVLLHAQRATFREVPVVVEGDASVLPVRVRPAALVQAILALVTVAARHAQDGAGSSIAIGYGGDAERTAITVAARGASAAHATDPDDAALTRAAVTLLADAGATLDEATEADARVWTVRVWTLLEARRRERAK